MAVVDTPGPFRPNEKDITVDYGKAERGLAKLRATIIYERAGRMPNEQESVHETIPRRCGGSGEITRRNNAA